MNIKQNHIVIAYTCSLFLSCHRSIIFLLGNITALVRYLKREPLTGCDIDHLAAMLLWKDIPSSSQLSLISIEGKQKKGVRSKKTQHEKQVLLFTLKAILVSTNLF